MTQIDKSLGTTALMTAALLLLLGCGEPEESASAKNNSESHEGHNHETSENSDASNEHASGELTSLGSIELAGASFSVSLTKDVKPSSVAHLELEHDEGPMPTAIRFWIGNEAGTGALKSKADAHEDHFHGETETPSDLTGASLWIEVESSDGKRTAGSLKFD